MLIQLQSKYLAIFELELELPAIEPRIVLVDDTVVIGADDNDVRGVVVLRTGEVSMWRASTTLSSYSSPIFSPLISSR